MSHKQSLALATASLMEIISRSQALQAVVLRNGGEAEQEAIRREAHDLLDAYLDQSAEAATAVRSIVED